MKRLIVLLPAIISITALAQRHRHDSIPFGQLMSTAMRVPVLTGQTQPRIIVPRESRLCFNVEFDIKVGVGSRIAEQAMFINTSDGITGYLPPSTEGLMNIIMPEIPKFSFSVIGMKGNIYRYYNQKGKHDVLEHYVSTGNSETYQYQTTVTPGASGILFRKTETGQYCNGNMTARAYRVDGSATTWFIYGDRFPEKLHPRKYLGNFGVGYLYADEGIFLIVEMRSGAVQCKVTDIQNSNACLNAGQFVELEQKFNNKVAEDLQRENDNLAREEARISGHCVAEKTALLSFKKENQRRQEENLRKSKEGNLYQDPNAQKGILGMMDPLITVQGGILSTRLSICLTQSDMVTASPSGQQRDAEKLRCLNDQLSNLMRLESQMRALDQQYASQPARAMAEKGRLYYRNMPHGCE